MMKARHFRFSPWKSSSSTLILTMLTMFMFVILILLALGILSMLCHPEDFSKANDLNTIQQNMKVVKNNGKGEHWVGTIPVGSPGVRQWSGVKWVVREGRWCGGRCSCIG
ncbi:hypothetical protein Patl1_18279 [Pistacia atlantica]|uniref:Uncharacterized protein n=1 Tax=Pistacia atlantica TaxID=434234 RepID=A0ACC1BZ64_9ROSI|nr:hypothetical protein Patl1_18279 [Pistacia atlantica]